MGAKVTPVILFELCTLFWCRGMYSC